MSKSACTKHKKAILEGTMLAIDPSSGSWNAKKKEQSHIGWALYDKGVLSESGLIEMDGVGKTISERLHEVVTCLQKDFAKPDVLLIEMIRNSHSHVYLKWSVGVIIAALGVPTIEMNIATWKSYTDKDYIKSDEADAIYIGKAGIAMAKGELTAAADRGRKKK